MNTKWRTNIKIWKKFKKFTKNNLQRKLVEGETHSFLPTMCAAYNHLQECWTPPTTWSWYCPLERWEMEAFENGYRAKVGFSPITMLFVGGPALNKCEMQTHQLSYVLKKLTKWYRFWCVSLSFLELGQYRDKCPIRNVCNVHNSIYYTYIMAIVRQTIPHLTLQMWEHTLSTSGTLL